MMMSSRSDCLEPSWNLNLKHQRQDLNQAQEGSRSSHGDFELQTFPQIVPMSNFELAELTWENGQLGMHDLGGMFTPPTSSPPPPKPTWGGGGGGGRAGDTLESIVHQATYCNKQGQDPNSMPAPAHQTTGQTMERMQPLQPSGLVKKRTRETQDHDQSACASANAAFCRENNDTTMVTWGASLDRDGSPRSCTRTKTTTDEDSGCHGGSENQEDLRETKSEAGRSYTTRKGRAAAVHNQSERKRRDRINQKIKALQKLVPNASKTDKASMLDEVIDYLKQLQAQVQMMSNARFLPQIMMPLGMQQHLQMSLLARMGMGMGMGMGIGMLDTASIGHAPAAPQATVTQLIHPTQVATPTTGFIPPATFVVPQMVPAACTQQQGSIQGASTPSGSLQDSYSTFLAQSMNMDLFGRMAALQRQQQQQMVAQPASTQLQLNQHVQGG